MTRQQVIVRTYAKINLNLRVLGRRRDGFHELRTVFQTIGLHDALTCAARKGPFALRCRQPQVPLDESNLVWRAAEGLWRGLGRDGALRDVAITIDKQIPVQAGLGGGSADAAAALVGLARLWGARRREPVLAAVAASLGADVPFFLLGGTALGLGRGDEVFPLPDLPAYSVVLVLPSFGVSTADAYGWYDADEDGTRQRAAQSVPVPWTPGWLEVANDLERPVARRHAEIDAITRELLRSGALAASMSGSGSAVFGLFEKRAGAAAAARGLAGGGRGVLLTETMARARYERRVRRSAGAR